MTNGVTTPPNSPLTPADLDRINEALGGLSEAQAQAELAKRAGIDVGIQEERIREQRARLLRIKGVYFPGQ